jgi:hypothetical protein
VPRVALVRVGWGALVPRVALVRVGWGALVQCVALELEKRIELMLVQAREQLVLVRGRG